MKTAHSIILILLVFIFTSCEKNDYSKIVVIEVIDGDTLRLETGQSVRLIGIDCPEMYESDKLYRDARNTGKDIGMIIAQGEQAHRFTQGLVKGKVVSVEFDQEKYDSYGRLLAYVFLADGTFVNTEIVKHGYARPLTIAPNLKYADWIQQLYWEAQQKGRGLWK